MTLNGKKILIVDDEPDLRDILSTRFEMESCETSVAENGKVALDLIKNKKFDLVVSDIRMPEFTGIDLLEFIQRSNPSTAVILISGFVDLDPDELASKGASALIVKPFDLDTIVKAARAAITDKRD